MRIVVFFFLLILSSCTTNSLKNSFIYSENMSFEEFSSNVNDYAKNNSYPNIDN